MRQPLSIESQQTFLVTEDHEHTLNGTVIALEQKYPQAKILTAQNTQDALQQVEEFNPNLAIIDIAIPKVQGEASQTDAGLQLLKTLIERHSKLNIVVQSDNFLPLIRLKLAIDKHKGGFTVVAKSQSSKEFLTMVDWALKEQVCTPRDIRNGIELRPEWLKVLQLGCKEGLQDDAIAKRMNVNPKTVQNYWAKIRDVLEIYPDAEENKDKNIRMLTAVRAREVGLIDW